MFSYKIHPKIYDFDYEKQYATFQSKQINEYNPLEQTSDYDPKNLPSEQVKYFIYFILNHFSFQDSSKYL